MTQRAVPARGGIALAVAAAVLLLSGCDGQQDSATDRPATEATVSDETLAATIAGTDGFSVAADALKDAGLAQVFEGAAAYTVLLPDDAAFAKLGEAGKDLRTPEQRPALVAILRDHVVPGYLTPDDIAKAIEAAPDHAVAMRTMGGHTLTFTSDGGTIVAAGEDGSKARLAGEAQRASNGVAIPLDGVLRQVAAPTG
jgi:uncharacterized surface protein with fasciclin (FAS1) repeats